MAKPLAEQKDTVKAKRSKRKADKDVEFQEVDSGKLQAVGGGRVRRIVFSGEEPELHEEVHSQRQYVPRNHAAMHDIEFEIDNLGRIRRGEQPLRGDGAPAETVYRTGSGSVRRAYQPTAYGKRQVLYTTTQKGDHREQRRFSESDVDRVIAGVSLEPEVEVHREVKTSFIKRKRKVVEKVPVAPVDKKAAKKQKRAKKAKRAKPEKAAEPAPATFEPADKEYEPQCAAVTKDGLQCRNSSRHGSKYCGAHKGYKPRTLDQALAARDTAPSHDVAEDTKPGAKGKDESQYQAQCAAYTKDGLQCKNSSRASSKYCGSHKGYRAPSKEQLLKQMDTKPRWAKAKDTVPSVKGKR